MIDSRFRREEKFRRISPKALVRLLDAQPTPEDDLLDSPGHVVGEPQDGAPLALVLDLRDAEAFETNRIVGAENYPAQTLTRTQNNLTPSILKFANKEPTHVIVIYDDDERTASTTGAIFFEKGFDNVYVLSGGIKKFAMLTSRLVQGDVVAEETRPGTGNSLMSSISSSTSGYSTTSSRSGRSRRRHRKDLGDAPVQFTFSRWKT